MKNAVDAIGIGNGEISTIILKTENGIQLDITDTGKGINRTEWKNIFRPGYSSKRRGWGLGLSLTKRIINEIHLGEIKVVRSKPGETVFQIFFQIS